MQRKFSTNIAIGTDPQSMSELAIMRSSRLPLRTVDESPSHSSQSEGVTIEEEECTKCCTHPLLKESRKTETASTRVFFDAEPGVLALPPYSVRNACIGSIRDALHAGTRQASPATASSVAATVAKILGSSGRVP